MIEAVIIGIVLALGCLRPICPRKKRDDHGDMSFYHCVPPHLMGHVFLSNSLEGRLNGLFFRTVFQRQQGGVPEVVPQDRLNRGGQRARQKGDDDTGNIARKAESMFETGWHQDDRRRANDLRCAVQSGISITFGNVQDLEKSRMLMRIDFEPVKTASRKQRLAMKPETFILVRFLAVEPIPYHCASFMLAFPLGGRIVQ